MGKPLKYLLVEDSLDHAALLTNALKDANADNEVVHLRDGEKMFGWLRDGAKEGTGNVGDFDLVLLDLKMPRLNGLETLSILKSDPVFEHVPVVVVSTSRTEKEVRNCYRLGAAGYITKPVQYGELREKIGALNAYWSIAAEIPVHERTH